MEAWLVDKDFANYWIAARLVLSGQALDLFADHATYFRHLTAEFGPDYPWRNWSYPPHYLLLIWPAGFFGYVPAMAGFLAATLLAYLGAVRSFLGKVTVKPAVVVSFLFASVVSNIDAAQNSFLTSALMLGGLAFRDRRPVLAGVLIGCLTIKPQLGVFVPLLLLYERKWTVITTAALTTVGMIGLSALLFGWETWQGYLAETLPYQSRVMTEFSGYFLAIMPTVFGAIRSLGFGPNLALALHAAVAILSLAFAGMVLVRCQDAGLRAAILIMTTFVATPYCLNYDFGMGAAAVLLAVAHNGGATRSEQGRRALLAAASLMPILTVPLSLAGLPISPLLVLCGFAVVLLTASEKIASRCAA